jgi:DNA-binding transcriptional regulator LsrR (DeoR family)
MERKELLAQVAGLYYEESLTQAEIARRIGISRSSISRLLQEGREKGVVEIIIHYPWKRVSALERRLIQTFGLSDARVLQTQDQPYEEMLNGLGILAARYIENILSKDMILSISWGTTVCHVVKALRPARQFPITVVQMTGLVDTGSSHTDGLELARLLANIYGGEHRYLHAPLIVEDANIREALLQEPSIRETLALARRADIALLGIGTMEPELSSLIRTGYLDHEELNKLKARGVVGDICGQHYDRKGRVMEIGLNRRFIGIELEALEDIPHVIAVAGGKAKAQAILGALRGDFIKILVTDSAATEEVLRLDAQAKGDRDVG